MKIENKRIVEATDEELFQQYLNDEWFLFMDYDSYRRLCFMSGTKIIDEEKDDENNAFRDKLPDVIEVVRCKDCKYSYKEFPSQKDFLYCAKFFDIVAGSPFSIHDYAIPVLPDGYCSRGERRDSNGKA